eukprot:CAMPEP_0170062282 /NCGR_PEP_ID=MMETSP0019_2-20121128/3562_1 /TAXON_ID=98059 /ORGANISM="Dinobryon sp., Strain UTEXLB2267" /LENGTH=370 /DNA_ID=CAMNT_0010268381 /DNA_START=666 /DNA_END=1776 /DNA_ORIENTATION=-
MIDGGDWVQMLVQSIRNVTQRNSSLSDHPIHYHNASVAYRDVNGCRYLVQISSDWLQVERFLLSSIRGVATNLYPTRTCSCSTFELNPRGDSDNLMKEEWIITSNTNIFYRLEKQLHQHSDPHSVLILGDGDFSFAVAVSEFIRKDPQKMFSMNFHCVASSLETKAALLAKYPTAEANIHKLNQHRGFHTAFEVDATNITGTYPAAASSSQEDLDYSPALFDAVIFNFPYADTLSAGKGRTDSQWDTFWVAKGRHMQLLRELFRSSRAVLVNHGAVVYVSLLLNQLVAWDVEGIAREEGFRLKALYPFNSTLFAALGYSPKRTYSDAFFPLTLPSNTIVESCSIEPGPDTEEIRLLDLTTFPAWTCEFVW